jgi:hypothetical protein
MADSDVLPSLRGSTYRSVRLASSLAAALLNGHFEQPANQVCIFLPCFHSNTPTQSVSSSSVKTLTSTIHLSSTNLYLL